MDTLLIQITKAKEEAGDMDAILKAYLPFIKKQLQKTGLFGLEYDDALSIAMVTFVNCVKQYKMDRAEGFFSFVSTSIHNRLIDESRKIKRYRDRVSIQVVDLLESPVEETKNALNQYNKEQERMELLEEINRFSEELQAFHITFQELGKLCPKQKKARRQCIALAKAIMADEQMRHALLVNKRISQTQLAEAFSISPKTIEKHRKYIMAVSLLYAGDYPGISSFLPKQWGDDEI